MPKRYKNVLFRSFLVVKTVVKIGELMSQVPRKQGFASSIRDNGVANVETKQDVIHQAGFTVKQVQQRIMQKMKICTKVVIPIFVKIS